MKRPSRKAIIWILVIILVLGIMYLGRGLLAVGSYPYAQHYELNAAEDDVIKAVKQFRTKHPETKVPYTTINGQPAESLSMEEGRRDSSYWYAFYFYFPSQNEVFLTLTRPSENGKTDFSLVSVNKTLDLPHWKTVNEDFNSSENKRVKSQFEAILKQLKIEYRDTGNNMTLW